MVKKVIVINKGRPGEHAKAKIRIDREKLRLDKERFKMQKEAIIVAERLEQKRKRQRFFVALDIVTIVSLVVAIYSFYTGKIMTGILAILISGLILTYFLARRYIKTTIKRQSLSVKI